MLRKADAYHVSLCIKIWLIHSGILVGEEVRTTGDFGGGSLLHERFVAVALHDLAQAGAVHL